LLGQAEIIGGTIPNMIAFGIFCLFKFLFCKNWKKWIKCSNGTKKSREKSLDLYED
jgi:hypothetical protein